MSDLAGSKRLVTVLRKVLGQELPTKVLSIVDHLSFAAWLIVQTRFVRVAS